MTDAFSISFEKLDRYAQEAMILAQLAPTPIPEAFMQAVPDKWSNEGVRAALRSRHFVISHSEGSFGMMHRLVADFLLGIARRRSWNSFGRHLRRFDK